MKTYSLFDNTFFREKPNWMPKKLYNVVCQRANVRTEAYMLALVKEKYPESKILAGNSIQPGDRLILLYSDSIGLGFRSLENKYIGKHREVMVLNGRKRLFVLTSGLWKQLLIKRFFEMTFLPECMMSICVLIAGSFLALKDKIAGHS